MAKKTRTTLRKLLRAGGVDDSPFGVGPTKSIDELLEEWKLRETEFVFEGDVLIRRVRRAQVRILFKDADGVWHVLVETLQRFSNGSTRKRRRKWSVVEKRIGDEASLAAAKRGVKDELGVEVSEKRFRRLGKVVEKAEPSSSYPGLVTRYVSTRYELVFSPEEFRKKYTEVQPGKKTTYFSWKPAEGKQKRKRA